LKVGNKEYVFFRLDALEKAGLVKLNKLPFSIRIVLEAALRRHGLTFSRYEVLAWLATDPEPAPTLSWISRTLRMPPASVTNVIDHLEGKGLIRRVAHPSDARTTLAEVTAKGRQLDALVTRQLNSEVYEQIALAEPDRATITELLRQLRASANEFDVTRSEDVISGMGAGSSTCPGSTRGCA
jgi:DNA-binding MarR family transcriptional regulator